MALGSTITQVTDSGLKPGITFPNFVSTGIATATNFKTGTSNLHNVGLEVAGINVLGGDTPIGTGATVWRDGGALFSGIVSATSFKGDGSALTGVVQSDTPLGNNTASTTFYETDNSVSISTSTTLSRASSNPGIIYTKFNEIVVGTAPGTVELVVSAGEELVIDAYQLSIDPS